MVKKILFFILFMFAYFLGFTQCGSLVLSADKQGDCAPSVIEFRLTNAPLGSSYEWDFGNGFTAGGDTTYSFFNTGQIVDAIVNVTLPNGNVCTVTENGLVTIYDNPTPEISLSDTQLCDGPETITLTDNTPNVVSRSWVIDATNYSNTAQSISHKFVSSGYKSISIIVQDSNRCQGVAEFEDTIIVYDFPVFDFEADITQGCMPQTINYVVTKNPKISNFSKSFTWNFPGSESANAMLSGTSAEDISYPKAGSYNSELNIEVSNGCNYVVTKQDYINLGDTIEIQLTSINDTICRNTSFTITLTDTSLSGSVDYAVSGVDAEIDDSHAKYITVNPFEVGYIHVEATYDYNGCITTINEDSFLQVRGVEAAFTSPDHYHCLVPHVVHLESTSDTMDAQTLSYQWKIIHDTGIVYTSTAENPQFTFNEMPAAYDVELIITGDNGCVDTLRRDDFIYQDTMLLDFDVSPKVVCPEQIITVVNQTRPTTYQAGDEFMWYFYDRNDTTLLDSSEERAPQFSYDSIGFYDIYVIGSNDVGCNDTLRLIDVIEVVRPDLDYSITDEISCIRDTAILEGLTQPDRAAFIHEWSVRNVRTDSTEFFEGQNIDFIPYEIGEYMVTYQHRIDNGCRDIDSTRIYVNGIRTEINLSDSFGCKPLAVVPSVNILEDKYQGEPSASYKYNWTVSPSDNNTISDTGAATPFIRFMENGDAAIDLEITNAAGCTDNPISRIVRIGVRAGFDIVDDIICLGTDLEVIDKSYNGVTRVTWNITPNNRASRTESPSDRVTFTIDVPGDYQLEQIVTNDGNCYDTVVRNFTVIEVVADFQANDSFLQCAPVYAEFESLSQNADTLFWNFGEGDEFSTTSRFAGTIYQKNSGWTDGYDIQLVAMNAEGCYDTLLKEDYVVVAGPVPRFDLENAIGCEPLEVSIIDGSSDVSTRFLNYNDGSVLDSTFSDGRYGPHIYRIQSPTAIVEDIRPTLIVYDSTGCLASYTSEEPVTIYRKPEAHIFYPDGNIICERERLRFIDTSRFSTLTAWHLNDEFISNNRIDSLVDKTQGNYNLTLVSTNSYTCSDTLVDAVSFNVKPQITIQMDDTICLNQEHEYSASVQDGVTIDSMVWTMKDREGRVQYSFDENNPFVRYSQGGWKDINVWIQIQNGCADTANKEYLITTELDIDTPEIEYISFVDETTVEVRFRQSQIPQFSSYVLRYDGDEVLVNMQSDTVNQYTLLDKPITPVSTDVKVIDYCNLKGQPSAEHRTIILQVESNEPYVNNLTWTPYIGWDSIGTYRIFRSTEEGNYELIGSVNEEELRFRDTNLCDQEYIYRVAAVHPSASFSSYSYRVGITPIYDYNPEPSNIKNVTVSDDGSIDIYWESSQFSEFKEYKLLKYQSSFDTHLEEFYLEDTFYNDVAVNTDEYSYIYQLAEIDRCGYPSEIGREGKSILLSGEYNEGSILDWTAYEQWQNGVSAYIVDVRLNGEFTRIHTNNGAVLNHVDASIYEDELGAYCYRVKGNNTAGDTSFSNIVCLFGPPETLIPSAFTPNNDGLNDGFNPISNFLKEKQDVVDGDFNLSIYNRWGELIYKSNDIDAAWDGTYRGEQCPPGVYLYMVKLTGMDETKIYENGTVTLLR